MPKSKKVTEESEYKRLAKIYKTLPPNKRAVAEGLLREAARQRVRLNYLWEDLQEHGETEMFCQSSNMDPYERERPASRTYTATEKTYQSLIRQLDDMCPPSVQESKLEKLMEE